MYKYLHFHNKLQSVGVIPDIWKQAVIVPVFKKGATCDVANYRPISLTCVASKIMERHGVSLYSKSCTIFTVTSCYLLLNMGL